MPFIRHRAYPLIFLLLFTGMVYAADSTVIAVGNLHTFVSNRTQPYGRGPDAQTFRIGRNDFLFPSMEWKSENQPNNHYLYNGTFWVGMNGNTVRFAPDANSKFQIFANDPSRPAPLVVSFTLSDDSAAENNRIGIQGRCRIYAWADPPRDNFLIYCYDIMNRSGDSLSNVYAGLLMDFDISAAENSSMGNYDYWEDDRVGFSLNADHNDITESISYMYDGENPNGQPSVPAVNGYIGTRVIDAPPSKNHPAANRQSGHHWIERGFFTRPGAQAYALLENVIFDQTPGEAGDYRYMQSLGPWNIGAGDSLTLSFAVGIGSGLISMQGVLQAAYRTYWQNIKRSGLPEIIHRAPESAVLEFNSAPVQFSVTAQDADGDSLRYTWLVDGRVSQRGDSHFELAELSEPGNHIVSVDVSDGKFAATAEWLLVANVPKQFSLGKNFPNPFNGGTNIRFEITQASNVAISIINTLGQQVARVIDEPLQPGKYLAFWNGRDRQSQAAASGIYFLELKTASGIAVRKIVLMR